MNPFTKTKEKVGKVSPTEPVVAMFWAMLTVGEAHYAADSGILTATGNNQKDVVGYMQSLLGSEHPAVVVAKQKLSV